MNYSDRNPKMQMMFVNYKYQNSNFFLYCFLDWNFRSNIFLSFKKLCWKFLKLSSLPSHSLWPGSPLHCKHVVITPQTKTGTKYSTHFDPKIRKLGNFQLQKLGQTPKKCSTILTFSSHRNMVESARTYTFNQLKRIWCNTLKLLLQKPSCQYLWVSASIHASSIVSISH